MRLFDVEHQWQAQRRVQQSLAGGRVPHAYLLEGPEGVGKAMFAQRLARLLLCSVPIKIDAPPEANAEQAWSDACGQCPDCTMLAAGTHPDYHVIYRGLNKFHPDPKVRDRKAIELGVDVVRHFLLNPVAQRPARGRAKVFIVPEAERLSTGAQNALLKTLEEPPDASYVVLTAASADRLLPTTRSRCQVVPFGGLPTEFVFSRLTRDFSVPEDDARYLAGLCQGRLGVAVRLARQKLAARRAEILELARNAAADPLVFGKALKDMSQDIAEQTSEEDVESTSDSDVARRSQLTVLTLATALFRDVLRVTAGSEPVAHVDPTTRATLQSLAREFGPAGAAGAIRALAAAEHALSQNANVPIVFDVLGLDVARAGKTHTAAA